MRGFDRPFATHTGGGDSTGFCQIPPLIVPMYISGTFSVVACRICQLCIFLEFFLWLCLLIKAHGNNMSCDVVKRGRSCYFHEWRLHIWNYLFLPLFFNMFVWIDIYFICVDIFGYCVHRTAWSFAPGQKGDSCMQVIKQVHLNRMNGLETFQTHH